MVYFIAMQLSYDIGSWFLRACFCVNFLQKSPKPKPTDAKSSSGSSDSGVGSQDDDDTSDSKRRGSAERSEVNCRSNEPSRADCSVDRSSTEGPNSAKDKCMLVQRTRYL